MRYVRSILWMSTALVLACGGDDGRDDSRATEEDRDPTGSTPEPSDSTARPRPRDASVDLDARTSGDIDSSLTALDATAPLPSDAGRGPEESDASPLADASPATDDAALDGSSPETAACPAEACPNPAYPCAPSNNGEGYSCLGQFAAWPMPDSQAGAKVAPSYTVREGVVRDEVTGLLWQRELPELYTGCTRRLIAAPGDGCTWEEARAYCEQLTLAGKSWRLPSKVEWESLIDSTAEFAQARLDAQAFPDTDVRYNFWTKLRGDKCGGEQSACQFLPLLGIVGSAKSIDEAARVRCVHSEQRPDAPPGQRFAREGDVIRDRHTTLEWHAARSPETPSPEQASEYCASLEGEWRMPTIKELASLADETAPISDDPIFGLEDERESYWSSTAGILELGPLFYNAATGLVASQGALGEPSLSDLFVLRTRCVR